MDRRTSSFEEETLVSNPFAHPVSSPARPTRALQTARASPPPDERGVRLANRLKGLGLAGISTVFQATISVCAKELGAQSILLVHKQYLIGTTVTQHCIESQSSWPCHVQRFMTSRQVWQSCCCHYTSASGNTSSTAVLHSGRSIRHTSF